MSMKLQSANKELHMFSLIVKRAVLSGPLFILVCESSIIDILRVTLSLPQHTSASGFSRNQTCRFETIIWDSIKIMRKRLNISTPCLDKDLVVSLVRLYSLFLTAPTIIANKYCQWNRGECFWNNYDYEQYSGSEFEPITCNLWFFILREYEADNSQI